jgi:transcriptional accessory protein Tex/SPT6
MNKDAKSEITDSDMKEIENLSTRYNNLDSKTEAILENIKKTKDE